MSPTARLGGLVRRVIRDLGLEARLLRHTAAGIWPEIAGAEAARHSRATAVRGDVLFVATRTPAWAHNLTFFKKKYIERLEERLGKRVIEDIRFSSRGWQESDQSPAGSHQGQRGSSGQRQRAAASEMEPQQRSVVEGIAAPISDEDLRRSVVRGLSAELRARQARSEKGWSRCPVCGKIRRGRRKCCQIAGE